MPNWTKLSQQTKKLEPKVQEIYSAWLKENPDWTGWIVFNDYPPRFMGRFEILHINQLSENRLAEVGKLTTKLCNECGLLGKKFYGDEPAKNRITYKFWLPIK